MRSAKAAEARQQPFDGKGGQHGRAQDAGRIVLVQPLSRAGNAIESAANLGEIGLSRVGQQETAAGAAKELEAKPLFERADLVADRRLGDVEFGSGGGKAEMTCGGLESAQGVERRQGSTHEENSPFR